MLAPQDVQLLVQEFSKVFATKEELSQLKNDVLDKMDAIQLEVKNMRQE